MGPRTWAPELPGTENDDDPAWSPDGRRLAVTSDSNLVAVALDGSDRRTIADRAVQPTWSVRGVIAFRRGGDVYTVTPGGTNTRRLTFRGGAHPSWSPSGRRLVFERGRSLYVIRPDGPGRRKLASRATRPVWSPDGRYVAFLREMHQDECGYDGIGCDILYLRLIPADGRHHSHAVTVRE